jgi:hypothetical protein
MSTPNRFNQHHDAHHDAPRGRHDDTRTPPSLDMKLFSPERLQTAHGLRAARRALDIFLHFDKLRLMVVTLMDGPANLLEYVIAVASEWILHLPQFTTDETTSGFAHV